MITAGDVVCYQNVPEGYEHLYGLVFLVMSGPDSSERVLVEVCGHPACKVGRNFRIVDSRHTTFAKPIDFAENELIGTQYKIHINQLELCDYA